AISYDDLNVYLDAYEKLIIGFMLGVIDISEEKERRTFHYSVQWEASPGVVHSRKIGDEYFAIKRLEGSSDMKREITDRIAKKKMKMEMDTELLWNYYSLLRYYWKDVFPLRYRGSKADPVEIESYEYRVILNEMQAIGNKLKKAMETAGYTEEQIGREFNSKFESLLLNLDMFSRQVGDTKRRVLKG
ncbi:MAG: hypothetical protein L0Y73_08585, partial [Candidatus Aminicenantes bacterium]|nr:hypothetical protein [Candidatus Aminicenantes bacterium]